MRVLQAYLAAVPSGRLAWRQWLMNLADVVRSAMEQCK